MKNIYLDQNKWIDLARAATGHRLGEPFVDVLHAAKHAVNLGIARFPLSAVHYMELYNTKRSRRRQDVARIMLDLSRPSNQAGPLTIAGPSHLMTGEIDAALQRRYGRPIVARTAPAYGYGVGHAFGHPELVLFAPPDGVRLDSEQLFTIERFMEQQLLSGPADDFPVPGISTESHRAVAAKHLAGATRLVNHFRQGQVTKTERDNTLMASLIVDLLPKINEAFSHAGISKEQSNDLESATGLTSLMHDVPMCHVENQLERLRHDDSSLPRRESDLGDLGALIVAMVYCDVIVTERFWVHLIRRSGLDLQYGTIVLHDVRDLQPMLLGLN